MEGQNRGEQEKRGGKQGKADIRLRQHSTVTELTDDTWVEGEKKAGERCKHKEYIFPSYRKLDLCDYGN